MQLKVHSKGEFNEVNEVNDIFEIYIIRNMDNINKYVNSKMAYKMLGERNNNMVAEIYDYAIKNYPNHNSLHLGIPVQNSSMYSYDSGGDNNSFNSNIKAYCKDPLSNSGININNLTMSGGSFSNDLRNYLFIESKEDVTTKKNDGTRFHYVEICQILSNIADVCAYYKNSLNQISNDTYVYVKRLNYDQSKNIIVMGDLHGSLHGFLRCLARLSAFGVIDLDTLIINDAYQFVFLGDIINYSKSIHIYDIILKLILVNDVIPKRNDDQRKVLILQGNHEHDFTADKFESIFKTEINNIFVLGDSHPISNSNKYVQSRDEYQLKKKLYEQFVNFFKVLPVAIVLENSDNIIYLSHSGGLPNDMIKFITASTEKSTQFKYGSRNAPNTGYKIINSTYSRSTKSSPDPTHVTENIINNLLSRLKKQILILRGHEDKSIKTKNDDGSLMPFNMHKTYNTIIEAKGEAYNGINIERFKNDIHIDKHICPTVNQTVGNILSDKKEIAFFNHHSDYVYGCNCRFVPNNASKHFYPIITTCNNTGNNREMLCDSFVIISNLKNKIDDSKDSVLSYVACGSEKKLYDHVREASLMTYLLVNEKYGMGNNVSCNVCLIRSYNSTRDIIPVSFDEPPRNPVYFNLNDNTKRTLRCTTFDTLISSTIHGKTAMFGLLPNPVDMLYLPDRGTACSGHQITNDDFECYGKRRFDMSFYTTNMYNYAAFYAQEPLDIMLQFNATSSHLKIIYFSSQTPVNFFPMFNQQTYGYIKKIKDQKQKNAIISTYKQMWEIFHSHYDVMVISNFLDWNRGSNLYGSNNDAFQVNFTLRGLQKLHVNKIYVNPTTKPTAQETMWLNYKKYGHINTQAFKTFATTIKIDSNKPIKLADFRFFNIGDENFESKVETFDPKYNHQISNIKMNGESVNLLYAKFGKLFDGYRKVKSIQKYSHLF